jgi:hypothetical protein
MMHFFREDSELAVGLCFGVGGIVQRPEFHKTSIHETFGYEMFTENDAVNRKKFMNFMIVFKGTARSEFLPNILGAPLLSLGHTVA